jgi:hypothetical protein
VRPSGEREPYEPKQQIELGEPQRLSPHFD